MRLAFKPELRKAVMTTVSRNSPAFNTVSTFAPSSAGRVRQESYLQGLATLAEMDKAISQLGTKKTNLENAMATSRYTPEGYRSAVAELDVINIQLEAVRTAQKELKDILGRS
jgi:hypothetical protein